MTISEESPDPQTGKKLAKSLDAVAALRKAMEQRLAEAEAAHPLADTAPAPQMVDQAAPIETLESPHAPAPSSYSSSTGSSASETPAPKDEPQAPAQTDSKQETVGDDNSQEEAPLSFDPALWTQIMIHVSEEGQKLIRDYIVRTRDKPVDTLPFTSVPVMDSLSQMAARFLDNPETYTDAQLATWQNYIDLTRSTLLRLQGHQASPIAEASSNDKRFKAKDWQTNWAFDFLKQAYLSNVDEARRLVRQEASNVEDKMARKVEFYLRLFLDATAPSNFWMTNPEVLRVTVESKGENLIKGLKNLLQDLENGNGLLRISMSDYKAFELGKTIATSPGKIVYQNDLMQLIQYAPATPSVRTVPLLIIPPWINKYYILDLRQKNSFIHYLVAQGYTVFCISWVNPTKRHALTQFEDYMDKGAMVALTEVKRLTGANEVNVLGYCIGGTLLACLQAYLAALPEQPSAMPKIASSTYLVTMVDFSKPGDLGVFIDEDQIRLLEERMARQGFMDAKSMMLTFNLLRANDLIWPFVINNYLLGREPFPFDILYWNTDSTNLPAAMQSYYLRNMYLNNKLVQPNGLKMKDVPIDLAEISTPSFVLATREDHIAPWRSTYAATQLYKGPVTFVLSGSGHIAGVVNPPDAHKYDYWTNQECPENPDDWFKNAAPHKGSWWPEWIKWLDAYAGETIPAREIFEGIEDAPGSYVQVRAL